MALPRYLFLLVEIVSIFGLARGFSSFRLRVPNGDQEIASSKAIGHIRTSGGGARNNFGRNFDGVGKVWGKDLCCADSE